MDILEKLNNSLERDLIISISENKPWKEFRKEIKELNTNKENYKFNIDTFPKTNSGRKCYIAHKNKVVGWLEILKITRKRGEIYLELKPRIHSMLFKNPIKSFEGYKYYIKGYSEQ